MPVDFFFFLVALIRISWHKLMNHDGRKREVTQNTFKRLKNQNKGPGG